VCIGRFFGIVKPLTVPRHYVFVLQDGTQVVRVSTDHLQNIMTGEQTAYQRSQYGHSITDGELQHLHTLGYVVNYSVTSVTLRIATGGDVKVTRRASNRIRAYYIATSVPGEQLGDVWSQLPSDLEASPAVRDGLVAIYGAEGYPFEHLQDAEDMLQKMSQVHPVLFEGAFVSVYEVVMPENSQSYVDTQTVPAVAVDTTHTAGKVAMIVGGQDDQERATIQRVLQDQLLLEVYTCLLGGEALPLVEDHTLAVIIVDLQLTDMHGWAFIRKLREIPKMTNLPLVVISDDPNDMIMALKVVHVSAFIARPLDMDKLREKIWLVLQA
jgi:CheY-like chemotaxis protein